MRSSVSRSICRPVRQIPASSSSTWVSYPSGWPWYHRGCGRCGPKICIWASRQRFGRFAELYRRRLAFTIPRPHAKPKILTIEAAPAKPGRQALQCNRYTTLAITYTYNAWRKKERIENLLNRHCLMPKLLNILFLECMIDFIKRDFTELGNAPFMKNWLSSRSWA